MKKSNVLKIVLLTFVLAGVVGAAAALTKGFKEIPEFVLSETETIEHHDGGSGSGGESPQDEPEIFDLNQVVECKSFVYIQDKQRTERIQEVELDPEPVAGDFLLSYKFKSHDILNLNDENNPHNATDYYWGMKIAYILNTGAVHNEYYGCNSKNKPNTEFPVSVLYGSYAHVIYSFNGIEPDNDLYLCSTLNTKADGKIFIMSSGSEENPDTLSYTAELLVNDEIHNLVSESNYPYRDNLQTYLEDDEGIVFDLSLIIEDHLCNDTFKTYEYEKDENNNDLLIDNSDNEYSKFYLLFSQTEQTNTYLDELVDSYVLIAEGCQYNLYIYGLLNEDEPDVPPVVKEAPDHPGYYKLSFTNQQMSLSFDDYNELNILSKLKGNRGTVYFRIEQINVYKNGSIQSRINGDYSTSCSRTNLSIRLGNNPMPSWYLLNDNDSILSIGLDNNYSYEILIQIVNFTSEDCFGQFFIDNYTEISSEDYTSYSTTFSAYDYLVIEPKTCSTNKTIYLDDLFHVVQIDTDNCPDSEYLENCLFNPYIDLSGEWDRSYDDWVLKYYKIDTNLNITLGFEYLALQGELDPIELEIGKGRFSLYVYRGTNIWIAEHNLSASIEFLDNNGFSQLITRRNDLKMTSDADSYQIKLDNSSSSDSEVYIPFYVDGVSFGKFDSDGLIDFVSHSMSDFDSPIGFNICEIVTNTTDGLFTFNAIDYEWNYDNYSSNVYINDSLKVYSLSEGDCIWLEPQLKENEIETGIFQSFTYPETFQITIEKIELEEPQISIIYQTVSSLNFHTEREYIINPNIIANDIGRLTQTGKIDWYLRDKETMNITDSRTGVDSFEIVGNDNPKHMQCKKNGSNVVEGTQIDFDEYSDADYYVCVSFRSGFGGGGYNQNIVYSNFIGYIAS